MKNTTICLYCGQSITGRCDKKYCDKHCKNAFHNDNNRLGESSFYYAVNRKLRNNRRLLKHYNRAGKATMRCEELHDKGFDSNFFTHYWKNNKGEVYLFVYEYGFIRRVENDREKYILIKWQEYMRHKKG